MSTTPPHTQHLIELKDYTPADQPHFEQLNRAWIEKYFRMEPIDEQVLQHPHEHILTPGGAILMAVYDHQTVGTVALRSTNPGIYELTKMAVDPAFRGKKIGIALIEGAINKARQLGAHKVILYSNTLLTPAITLYHKMGFTEVPVDGPYERCNIKMEINV